MSEQRRLEFFLVQYAPNPLSQNSVNIAVVLFDPISPGHSLCKTQFASQWQSTIQQIDPNADIPVLEALALDIERELSDNERCESMLGLMETSFTNMVRVTDRQAITTSDPKAELDRLVSRFL